VKRWPSPYRRTKLVCTLGPSTDAPGTVRRMVEAGMDVARINAAHGSEAEHSRRIAEVRRVARAFGRPLAVLLDLPGPKLRLGRLSKDSIELRTGARVTLASGHVDDPEVLPVRIARFARQTRVGEPLALADGSVRLRVERIVGERVRCRVEIGGTVRSGSGINLPESHLALRLPTAEDERWIRFAVRERIDWLGISFVRGPDDVAAVRRRVRPAGSNAPALLAKIEKRAALERLDEVIAVADGVMVARGDLGVETPLPEVPIVQKRIIAAALRLGRPVVTATQMLESMVDAPAPTRAEVADVANAVLDGTDAVMLSAETAIGRHPVRAVETLRAVALATEPAVHYGAELERWVPGAGTLEEAMSAEAGRLAGALDARAILVAGTELERVAALSRLRPRAPIVVYGSSEAMRRRLAIVWGTATIALPPSASVERRANALRTWLRERLGVRGGRAVMLSTSALGADRLDTLRVVELD
jgi:pyruvate kinase